MILDYIKTSCFEPFPFPALEEGDLKQRIRDLGERLDAHRKRQQELHPDLTLTGIYNVLEKLRAGEALTAKDKEIHDKGLVSVLKQIHDDLDAAVLEAYGWADLATAIPLADILARGGPDAEALEQQLLTRLVALNHERAAEEKRGLIRWLRPDFQAPGAATAQQAEIGLSDDEDATPDTAAACHPRLARRTARPSRRPPQAPAHRRPRPRNPRRLFRPEVPRSASIKSPPSSPPSRRWGTSPEEPHVRRAASPQFCGATISCPCRGCGAASLKTPRCRRWRYCRPGRAVAVGRLSAVRQEVAVARVTG